MNTCMHARSNTAHTANTTYTTYNGLTTASIFYADKDARSLFASVFCGVPADIDGDVE